MTTARRLGAVALDATDPVSVTVAAQAVFDPTVTLLREDGSGAPYTIPTGRNGDYYRRVPEQAWNRLIGEPSLTGPGLAMYLVAVRTAEQARRNTGRGPAAHTRPD